MDKFDFSGWATKADLKCSDGRVIRKDAFKNNDGQTVPLVWNHQHDDPTNVLGHALLKNRDKGVYAYCTFNETEQGQNAKKLVEHGDVTQLSIYANKLKQEGPNVLHGAIREVSLVLAGANPGACIESIMIHGEESDEAGVIFTGENIEFAHSDDSSQKEPEKKDEKELPKMEPEKKEKTVKEVFDSMTEEQQTVVYALVGQAVEDALAEKDENEGDSKMKHNVFDNDEPMNTLSHSDMESIVADAKRNGSLKDAFLAHAVDASGNTVEYGIADIDYLFPEAKSLNTPPEFIKRDTSWVSKFIGSAKHLPFSRVKSQFANIKADEARAKGYTKGNRKIEEVITLLKRSTTPTTIYKKQKLDRDDIIDITDFDTVGWIKGEMRVMLDEEIARAALLGDGRLSSDDDHIPELNIRPIWTDDSLFAVNKTIALASTATDDDKAKYFIKGIIKARKDYKGSGTPTLYTTEDMLTNCLLLEDTLGHALYDTVEKLATKLRVKEIVTVEVMEGLTREVSGVTRTLMGIIVNPFDYSFGADKGGSVNMFDDFDIDFNQQKYLMETRCSGALTKPYSAIIVESTVSGS